MDALLANLTALRLDEAAILNQQFFLLTGDDEPAKAMCAALVLAHWLRSGVKPVYIGYQGLSWESIVPEYLDAMAFVFGPFFPAMLTGRPVTIRSHDYTWPFDQRTYRIRHGKVMAGHIGSNYLKGTKGYMFLPSIGLSGIELPEHIWIHDYVDPRDGNHALIVDDLRLDRPRILSVDQRIHLDKPPEPAHILATSEPLPLPPADVTHLLDQTFAEGKAAYRQHLRYERSRQLVDTTIAYRKGLNPLLQCDVCSFDFEATYGSVGKDYIEVHHTKPVSEMGPGDVSNVEDMALVCANCHKMLHRKRPWLGLNQLKALLVPKPVRD